MPVDDTPQTKSPDASRAEAVAVLETLQLEAFDRGEFSEGEARRIQDAREGKAPDQAFFDQFLQHMGNAFGTAEFTAQVVKDALQNINVTAKEIESRFEDPTWFSLMKFLATRIDTILEDATKKPSRKIIFGTLPTGQVNGAAIDINNKDYYLIVIDNGVMGFANMLAKAIASSFPVLSDKDEIRLSSEIGEIKRYLDENPKVSMRLLDLLCAYVIVGHPHASEPYLPPPPTMRFAEIYRDTMELFVLSHEYGHCTLDHLCQSEKAESEADGQEAGLPPRWLKEFEADDFGTQVALAAMAAQGFDMSLTYAGVEMIFHGFELIERTVSVLQLGEVRRNIVDSHPPAELRRAVLRDRTSFMQNAEREAAAKQLVQIVNDIVEIHWQKMYPILLKMHSDGMRPRPRWVETYHPEVAKLLEPILANPPGGGDSSVMPA